MPPKPPAKQITSLNQIDISKMDIKDLQNVDYQKILANVRKKPDIAISIGVVFLAVFLCVHIFTKSRTERKSFSVKNIELEEKLQIFNEYTSTQNEIKAFKDSLPAKITENEFINKITDLAVKNNVQVESFSPGENTSDPIYDLTLINLTATAKDFSDVGRFVKDIENSGASIRINSWTGSMKSSSRESRRSRNSSNPDELSVYFQLDIALVTFKQ